MELFKKDELEKINNKSLIIDLASKPGGIDFKTADDLGLKTIHAFGIYHSDIKPGNIMCYRGQDGRMHGVLIDFGGSAAVQAEVQRNGGKNAPANVFSRGYQAPELLSGRVHEVSERTDAYSFGVTMAELIAGVYPYLGDIKNERATEKQKKYYHRSKYENIFIVYLLLF